MTPKIYSLFIPLFLLWISYLYFAFKVEKKVNTPVDFFIFGRQLPGWVFVTAATSIIFSNWIFFIHPSLIFLNGFPYAMTSLAVVVVPLIAILFLKRQWMLSKRYGFVTPSEMFATYFRSDVVRILIVVITFLFAIPFIALQLSLAGTLLNILSDGLIGAGSSSLLIGSVIIIYLSLLGIRSTVYFDTIQFFLVIFGLIVIGFSVYDLVGGWDLLNESLSRISNLKQKLFNLNINYESYLSIPGTIKFSEILDTSKYSSGIWTSSMILSFSFALAGIQMSPNFSMLTFASKEVKPFGTQQVWFSAFGIGLILIFFVTPIGVGSILLGANSVINENGNNIANFLPNNIFPNKIETLVPHLINIIGDYSGFLFGLLVICCIASIQSTGYFYLSSSAIITRDIFKRFFVRNMNASQQLLASRILLLIIFIISLMISIQSSNVIFSLGSLALGIACQMFVPLLAICYVPWFTKHGISLGLIVGIIAVVLTDSLGQFLFGNSVGWNKWPLSIHSSVWGVFFNLIASMGISYITQDQKEKNHKQKFHDFISDFKSTSLARRSLKPSAWIVVISWLFFAVGPGAITGNDLFGKPGNIESWSFGMPSIWVWKIIFWLLGVVLVWFLAFKMEMSTSPNKTIVSQTEDMSSGSRL